MHSNTYKNPNYYTVTFRVHVFSHAVISAECGLMTCSDRISYLLQLILIDCRDSIPHAVFKLLCGHVNLHGTGVVKN